MKKSTLFLVAAALVLGVVVLLVKTSGDKPAPKKLDIAGYASAEDLERDKKRGLMDAAIVIAHPIDEVILERADGTIRMVREGEGDAATWRITEPVDAVAVKWHVDAMVEVFKSPTTRSDARTIKPADFPLFDFEPARRVGLTLKSKGAVWNGVELIVGQLVKEAGTDVDDGVKGTWVMVKGDESTAYLLAGKDLRTPVNKTLSELRDKKVFSFEGDNISKIEITPESGPKVVLSATTTEEAPAPDAGPDAKPTKKTTWALTEPANVKGDAAVSSIARSLGSLRAEDFFPLDKADEAGKKALAGPGWRYTMTVDGKTETLKIVKGDKDKAWAQVEGRSEIMTLSSWTAKNLEKGLEDLKDKMVWDHPLDSVTRLTLAQEAGGAMTLVKDGKSWTFADGLATYTADPSSIMSGVAKLSAVRWARATEVEAARKMLATPEITASVTVGEAGGKALEVRFSAKLEGDDAQNRWGVVGDPASGEPFLVSDLTARRFVSKPETLRNKKVFGDVIDQVAAITVTVAGSTDAVRFEKGDNGQYKLLGMLPGETQNDEAVRSLVATLGALEVKTFHEGKSPTETGLSSDKGHVVGLELSDGRRMTLIISQTSSGDAEVYGLASDGPQKDIPVGLNEYQTKNIAKPRADFVGAPTPAPAP